MKLWYVYIFFYISNKGPSFELTKPPTYEVLFGTYIHRIPVKGVLGWIHGEPFMVFGTQYNIPSRKKIITTLNVI